MRLFIAEKPSLARAIAAALPGPQARRVNFIECGRDDVIAWCAGHILELAEPEAYAPEYKTWRLDHLPIVPAEWRLTVTARELLQTIRSLLPRASRVVNAGDPDREGQLLVDEVLRFLGYEGPVDRLLVSDLTLPAVRKALGEIQPNARFEGLYQSALARQRADWLFGINLTRLYTLLGRAGGYDGVLSVGRVQTPLLGLIVRRDIEIERFKSHPYFVVRAVARAAAGSFTCTWVAPDCPPGVLDETGRLVSREHAAGIRAKVAGKLGRITSCSRETRSEPPPLPYALADLQIDAGSRLGLGPKETLEACQALYETHRLLTYPRSNCSYLPEGRHGQAAAVLAAIATNVPALAPAIGRAERSFRSRAWNDEKVTAHHAIIPTAVANPACELSPAERGIYEIVARRYLAQFYGPFEYHETRAEIAFEGERFRAAGRQTIGDGWRSLIPSIPQEEKSDAEEDASSGSLPALEEGEPIVCEDVAFVERQTTPPKRFTEATLIQAMTGIARYVHDPRIKQILRTTDGIGTPATQAAIIQTLFDRHFIEKRGRQVASTPIGRALVEILPEVATRPDMTALWEAAMRGIEEGQMSLGGFLGEVLDQLRRLVESGRALRALEVPGSRRCVASGCAGWLRRREGKSGPFYSCTRYPDCKYTEPDEPTARDPSRSAPRSGGRRSRVKRPSRGDAGRL